MKFTEILTTLSIWHETKPNGIVVVFSDAIINGLDLDRNGFANYISEMPKHIIFKKSVWFRNITFLTSGVNSILSKVRKAVRKVKAAHKY